MKYVYQIIGLISAATAGMLQVMLDTKTDLNEFTIFMVIWVFFAIAYGFCKKGFGHSQQK